MADLNPAENKSPHDPSYDVTSRVYDAISAVGYL